MKASLVALVLLLSTEARAMNAATAAPIDPAASIHAVVGFPESGLGFRIPLWDRRLAFIMGAGVRFPLAAPSLDAGLGWRLRLPGPFRVDVAATGGLLAPLLPAPSVVTRAEIVTRGILKFRYARFWTGPELSASVDVGRERRFDVGGAWTVGAQARLWIVELGVVAGLGAKAAHNRAPWSLESQLFYPDAKIALTAAWVVPEYFELW